MTFETPLSTVWPAGIALVVLLASLWPLRRRLTLPRAAWVVVLVALAVRLFVVPAFTHHIFDGHEADYYDLFRGIRDPSRGGTVMVPAMQWFWWLIGHVLPARPWVPVALVAISSVLAIGLLSGALGLMVDRRAGWVAAILLTIQPIHAAWSSSAYNVMVPHLLVCLALYAVARLSVRSSAPGAWGWVAASAAALAVAFRMDVATIVLILVAWPLLIRPEAVTVGDRIKALLLPGAVGLGLALLAVWPLLWPGELPGAGERVVSFSINLTMMDVYGSLGGLVGLSVMVLVAIAAVRRRARVALPLIGFVVAHHLLMATFDDFGGRHLLTALPAIIGLLAIAGVGRIGGVLVVVAALLSGQDLLDIRDRYYGDEVAFARMLEQSPWAELPRVSWPDGVDSSCGWIVEDARVRRGAMASHFNLIRPEEEASLRGPGGCLRWCVDVQDWRWSSRSVRDRALRISHMFELRPAFVVEEHNTGYACLAMDVGPRRVGISAIHDGQSANRDHRIP